MDKIFLSYARTDYPLAKLVAESLTDDGWQVWWDADLRSGERFPDTIRDQISDASLVVVLWSKASAQSDWVRAEADLSRKQGKLMQFSIESAEIPLPFSQLHVIDLSAALPARPYDLSLLESGPVAIAVRNMVLAQVHRPVDTNLSQPRQQDRPPTRLSRWRRQATAGALAVCLGAGAAFMAFYILAFPFLIFKSTEYIAVTIGGVGGAAVLVVIYRIAYKWLINSLK